MLKRARNILTNKLMLLGLISLFVLSGYVMEDPNSKIKAIFIYNFTKYVEWPSDYKQGDFVIEVLGSAPGLVNELTSMAKLKKAGIQTIVIKNISDVGDIANCHILYIAKDKVDAVSKASGKCKGKSTLIVTEGPGIIDKGAGISFVTASNKQKFEIHQGNIKKYNLEVSSKLLPFAEVVK